MVEFIKIVTAILACVTLFLSCCLFIRPHSKKWILLMLPKMLANSLAFYIILLGIISSVSGLLCRIPPAFITGMLGSVILLIYIRRVSLPHNRFEKMFGPDWYEKIPIEQQAHLLKKRWSWHIPNPPEPLWDRNIPFWTIPDSDRQLICDIWQPPENIKRTGLALIYFHGGGWHALDKDFGTRPFFRHIAAQGHVIMDVAYRFCPEVDIYGMLGDAKRAIAWIKTNADRYGIDPDQIVMAGGSAGGHIALLGAYTFNHPDLRPDDIHVTDLSVKAVVSYYAPTDLRAFFVEGYGRVNDKARVERMKKNLLGGCGLPNEIPILLDKASPISYISPQCPPTLLFQGDHDSGVPVYTARTFYYKLITMGVPAIYVEFPQTEHGFDIQLKFLKLGDGSQYSPAAQAALYDTERFLALMASQDSIGRKAGSLHTT